MANDFAIVGGIFSGTTTTAQRNNFVLYNDMAVVVPEPVVSNKYPSDGAITAAGYIGFDVTVEEDTFAKILVWVKYVGDTRAELVYDGDAFTSLFQGTVTSITNGHQFRFKRAGGWPAANIQMSVQAVGALGGVN